jgi:protein gp37
MAARFVGLGQPYEGLTKNGHWTGKVELVEKHLLDPLKWGPVYEGIHCGVGTLKEKKNRDGSITVTRERPRRIFVNSMSDLFHDNVSDEWIDRVFAVMALCPQHTFQILTKRPERMLAYLTASSVLRTDRLTKIVGLNFPIGTEAELQPIAWPLPNVWLGVSVENQESADGRIPLLLRTPAEIRFVSCEPMLGKVDLRHLPAREDGYGEKDALNGEAYFAGCGSVSSQTFHGKHLDWVICGGESGPGARPMDPAWARSLRDQCKEAGVSFFMKQGSAANWKDFKNFDALPENLQIREFPGETK